MDSRPDEWAARFLAIHEEVRGILGADPRIEHIGSTAVPGLSAKDVVDVLIGVEPDAVAPTTPILAEHGFDRDGQRDGHGWLARTTDGDLREDVPTTYRIERDGEHPMVWSHLLTFLGSLLVCCGAVWQILNEARDWYRQMESTLQALDDLTQERVELLERVQQVQPWMVWKRRALSRAAWEDAEVVLTAEEKAELQSSDRAGWAWTVVFLGSFALLIGAGIQLFAAV